MYEENYVEERFDVVSGTRGVDGGSEVAVLASL